MSNGTLEFCLQINDDKYGESIDCTFTLPKNDEALSIEDYYYYCKQFAAAMGFYSKTIDEWFQIS